MGKHSHLSYSEVALDRFGLKSALAPFYRVVVSLVFSYYQLSKFSFVSQEVFFKMFWESCYKNDYLKTETFYFVLLRLIRLSFLCLSKERFSQTKNFLLLLTNLASCLADD